MNRKNFLFIIVSFLVWRVLIQLIALLSVKYIPLQSNFLGGGYGNYIENPLFWLWSNFDGEHYLAIARQGYQPLTYFFFPLYPILIKYISGIFGNSFPIYNFSAQIISNITFLISLLGIWKLVSSEFSERVAKKAIVLLLLFPTSFYFAASYTESLFLCLLVWSFYLARKGKFVLSGILALLLSATRIVGIVMLFVIIIELFKQKKINLWNMVGAVLSPMGLIIYMIYLKVVTGDFLEFFSSITLFGDQRSKSLILLPQVMYRYIFKILPNINYSSVFTSFTPWLEFIVGILFATLLIYSFIKLKLSYSILFLFTYIIPTLSGSFSSLPRYVLVIFPAFILGALFLKNKILFNLYCFVSLVLLAISLSFFARGFWLS